MTKPRLSLREQLIAAKQPKQQTVNLTLPELLCRMLGKVPRPTQGRFIASPARFKAYKGMAGCAKTSTIVAAELVRVFLQPGYKGFLARFNYNDLLGTTMQRAEEMLTRVAPKCIVGRDKTPPMRWWIQAFDGTVNELMFIGLKEYPGGYEWHHGGVDEASEVEDERTIQGLRSRLRAPSRPGVNPNYGINLAFNPPDEIHWLYRACTGRTHDNRKAEKWLELFEPVEGENDENLPPNYYVDNFKGMPQDMLDRLKHGKWGASFDGDPVYPQYNSQYHLADLVFDRYLPLLRFWDFGYRSPCCIWAQLDRDYRLSVLDETLGQNEEALPFIRRVLAHSNSRFPNAEGYLDFGDPAAAQKKDTGSTLSILASQGIELIFMPSSIEEGIRRTRFLLEQLVNGKPAIQFNRRTCPILHRTMLGGYRLHTNGRPLKDGYYDHLADALRYGIFNLFNESGRPNALPATAGNYFNPTVSAIPDTIEYDPRQDVL